MFRYIILSCLLFTSSLPAVAAPPAPYVQGKDYKLIPPSHDLPSILAGKVTVTEFFSYGCPWCYKLEPMLRRWKLQQPSYVIFNRVPVVFENGWEYYAKAFYVASALGIEKKITPALFKAVLNERLNLKDKTKMVSFFVKQGEKKKFIENAFTASPTIDAQMNHGQSLMKAYQIYAVPTFVIDSKYRTDLAMTKGDEERLMAILNYLTNKEKARLK